MEVEAYAITWKDVSIWYNISMIKLENGKRLGVFREIRWEFIDVLKASWTQIERLSM